MAVIVSPTPGAHFSNGLSTQSQINLSNATDPIAQNTRWQWNLTGAESSANAGSNLQLQGIADDGFTVTATAISVNRATGAVTITGGGGLEYFGDGSVTVPSIAFASSHSTGLYYTTNAVNITAAGVRAMQFATATTGVDYFVATPAAAGGNISLTAAGTDTDIGIILGPKGAGVVSLGGTTVANGSFHATTVSSAVDYLSVSGSTTGNHTVLVAAAGTDTDVSLSLQSKGAGTVSLGGTTQANSSLQAVTVSSAVDFLQVSGSATAGHTVVALATGTDTDVSLSLQSKGAGTVALGGTTQANSSLQVVTVASSVDFLQVSGTVTGTHVVLVAAAGTDTDVSLSIQGKGAGPTLLGVNATSNTIIGTNAALANSATAGLLLIPTTSGSPSGAPVGHGAGNAAIIADTSGTFKLFVYFEGTGWKSVTLS